MKRIIPVILVFVFLAGTGISNANTAVYIQETHLGAKNFFSAASTGSTPGEIRNNHTLKSHKRTVAYSVTVDQNGNTTQKGTQKFYYDYQNRVVRTADSQGTTTSEIKYDALGRRTQKIIGTDTLNYYYDGDMVIEERDGSDQVLRQYVNGNRIDEVCAIANYVNGIYANTYYVHTDGIGSTTAITDQAGNIVERVSYDVYGQPTFTDGTGTVIPGSTIDNTVLFQGRQYDTETNLYYFRARHYDPTMGRFLQNDPMGYKDSMNLYQAFNMNGVNYTDPMGKELSFVHEDQMKEDVLREHLIRRYGSFQGLSEFNQIIAKQRRMEGAMLVGFTIGAGAALIMPHLSIPAAIATVGSISSFSAIESYSQRKQAGQTEREAKRGAFGAATGFNLLFNMMGYDYGTLEGVSQEEIENAWGLFIGGMLGGRFSTEFEFANATAQIEETLPFLGTEPPPPNPIGKLHGHHTYPKALGGHPDQELAYILDEMHTGVGGVHSDLAKFEGGWLRPNRLMPGKEIVKQYGREAVEEGLRRFYSQEKWIDLLNTFENAVRFTLEKIGM